MLDSVKLTLVKKVIGTKQTVKMIKAGKAKEVFLARDVDPPIFSQIENLCKENKIPIQYTDHMLELGKSCSINRNAAAVAVLKD